MKLISEEAIEVNFVTEEDDNKKKNYFIEGIFMQSETKNRNGRVYPKVILQKEVKRYTEKFINTKRAFGELGHPDGPTVNLERVSHMITELVEDGDNFLGRAKIMDTPYGKIVKNLISALGNKKVKHLPIQNFIFFEKNIQNYEVATCASAIAVAELGLDLCKSRQIL